MMTTKPADDLQPPPWPVAFFLVTSSLIYVISEWIKYELAPIASTPTQPTLVRLFEWGPNFVSQIFVLAAILGTVVLLLRTSSRLFQKPSQLSTSGRMSRSIRSLISGVVAAFVYFLSVMFVFRLWNLTSLTLQLGIIVGMQFPLFKVWQFSNQRLIVLLRYTRASSLKD